MSENQPYTPDQDEPLFTQQQLITGLIIGLFVITAAVAWWIHPRSTFAADGLSERWDGAVEQSKLTHKPGLVLFTADWCGACQAFHADTLCASGVENEIAEHYTMVTVDMTAHGRNSSARASRYGVSAIPTIIRFDADGKETSRSHYMPPDRMLEWLKEGEPADARN